jgi:hypothetical protein
MEASLEFPIHFLKLYTKALLQEAGYICALTTIFGTNTYGHDLFALRRGQPWETDLPLFAAKLNWYKFCL